MCLALVGFILAMGIPARQSTPYYHMINKQDCEAFIWIRDNVGDNYEKAILDSWKATAFLRESGISIVYTQQGCNNPDLKGVRKDVYLLPKAENQ